MELIAGDIGGTKSWLVWVALPPSAAGGAIVRHERVYVSGAFASAEALVRKFIDDSGARARPDEVVLALPGPLHGQRARLTNLDWTLDAEIMRATLDVGRVRFLNDFEAAAAGIATLAAGDTVALNTSAVPEVTGVRVITGAGTGLGLAFMVHDGGGYRFCASEGGHIDFAPADALQARLLERLRTAYGHVSWERVVSGSALPDLYRFCCDEAGVPPPVHPVEGPELADRAAQGDEVASATLDLFIDLYGAWIGNVALVFQPRGGLYIAGGVGRHLEARMRTPRLMNAALDKGRMRAVVERTPVFLVTTARLGVQGALASAGAGWVRPAPPASTQTV